MLCWCPALCVPHLNTALKSLPVPGQLPFLPGDCWLGQRAKGCPGCNKLSQWPCCIQVRSQNWCQSTLSFHFTLIPPDKAVGRHEVQRFTWEQISCWETLLTDIGSAVQLSRGCSAACPSPAEKAKPTWVTLVLVANPLCVTASFKLKLPSHHFHYRIIASVIIFHRRLGRGGCWSFTCCSNQARSRETIFLCVWNQQEDEKDP